jgi:hypothetical protein
VPQTASPEAILVGTVVMFHTELMTAATGRAATFDAASPAEPFRGLLTSGCITFATVDAGIPAEEMRMDGCTDSYGSQYYGAGELSPLGDSRDGYAFLPYLDESNLIAVGNPENPGLQHTWTSGSMEFEFTRDTGGTVTSVAVKNFMRHFMRDEVVTFSFVGISFAGAPGTFAAWPQAGGVIRVGWDAVGVFDVTYSGGASCTFRLRGVNYECDLTNGTLRVASSL